MTTQPMNQAIYDLCLAMAREELDLRLARLAVDSTDPAGYEEASEAYHLVRYAHDALVRAFVCAPNDVAHAAAILADEARLHTNSLRLAVGADTQRAHRDLAAGANEARRRVLALSIAVVTDDVARAA